MIYPQYSILAHAADKAKIKRWVVLQHKEHSYYRHIVPAYFLEAMPWQHKYYDIMMFVNKK